MGQLFVLPPTTRRSLLVFFFKASDPRSPFKVDFLLVSTPPNGWSILRQHRLRGPIAKSEIVGLILRPVSQHLSEKSVRVYAAVQHVHPDFDPEVTFCKPQGPLCLKDTPEVNRFWGKQPGFEPLTAILGRGPPQAFTNSMGFTTLA